VLKRRAVQHILLSSYAREIPVLEAIPSILCVYVVVCAQVVHAQMALWVSGVVLFTLTVNAPALGPLMVALGLNKTTPLQRKMHRYVSVCGPRAYMCS
jgi:hypothetical protein